MTHRLKICIDKVRILSALILVMAVCLPLWAGMPGAALAVEPSEMLKDPVLEKRAREISKVLRCLVCQNQSIDDSNADLARDLRIVVRERLTKGDSDDEVLRYVVNRYGDYVLLKPPFKAATVVLWLGPIGIICIGTLMLVVYLRRRSRADADDARPTTPLSDDEKRRLKPLMKDMPS